MTPPLPPGLEPGGRHDDAWRPPQPSYVVADVDGTLLRPDGAVCPDIAPTVARLQGRGLRFGLATGRMRPAVTGLWQSLGASGPHILHNGAEVFEDPVATRPDGTMVRAWTLDRDDVDRLVTLAATRDAYVEIYVEDGYFVSDDRAPERDHWAILGQQPLGTLAELPGDALFPKAVFATTSAAARDELADLVAAMGLGPGPAHSPETPALHYLNVTHRDADKGRALQVAAGHLGIGLDRVVAVGDGYNDLPMFAVAGTAIAMGQAPAAVREAAHLVVPDADADGVVHALEACLTWVP